MTLSRPVTLSPGSVVCLDCQHVTYGACVLCVDAALARVTRERDEAEAECDRLDAAITRLDTIVNEAVGMQPVQAPEVNLSVLEHHLFAVRVENVTLRAENEALRALRDAVLAWHADGCPIPVGLHRRPCDCGNPFHALSDLIARMQGGSR